MKRTNAPRFAGTLLAQLLLLACAAVSAQVSFSHVLSFQGRLCGTDGSPLPDGEYSVQFTIYDAEADGTPLWNETQTVMQIGGVFGAKLGSVTAFPGDLFADGNRWLAIKIGDDPEMGQRVQFTPSPWSIFSANAGADDDWTFSDDDIYRLDGNVGIGTETPQGKLEVATTGKHAIWATTDNIPVYAHRESTSGTWPAVHGECDSLDSDGSAVRGIITCTSPGVHSAGVRGINKGTGGDGIGVYGSQDGSGWGVFGTTPNGIGVQGSSEDGTGVLGAAGGTGSIGVYGLATGDSCIGVFGIGLGQGGYAGYFNGRGCFMGDLGIHVQEPQASVDALNYSGLPAVRGSSTGTGVYGVHSDTSGTLPGVWGATDSVSASATGVRGMVNSTSPGGSSAGVRGHNNGTGAAGIGVWGSQDGSGYGVYGYTPSGRGVYGLSVDGVGVYGRCTNGYAGFFDGTVSVKVLEITGADVAEKFPVSEEVPPGMVVAIDPDNPGQLRLARGEYNRLVAGVVSGAGDIPTGAVLGNLPGCEDASPIALSGRVWVWCDATEQPIEPGDMLTTAACPGHAMKVTDYQKAQGAMLGKAMTSLKEGRGLVLVLVGLQ
jgi:hypothetical protein